jgi:PhzF family phenazine biosynthesis protein
MPVYTIYQVDAFTRELFGGNPAGVVPRADGLTEREMQKIARELNNSETAFVFSPSDESHDAHIRFFTPLTEVPVCGHATISAHYVRAVEEGIFNRTVVQKTGAGILPVDVIKEGDDFKVIMTQGKIVFEEPLKPETTELILRALKITESDVDEKCPVQVVSTGRSKVMFGIKSRRLLNSLKPDMAALAEISRVIKCNGFFVFTFDSEEEGILTNGRMFAPAIGINEDPVTGNAHGPLGAYIIKHKLVKNAGKEFFFRGRQGEAIGRPGIVEVFVDIAGGEPVKVKTGGCARIVFKTDIRID